MPLRESSRVVVFSVGSFLTAKLMTVVFSLFIVRVITFFRHVVISMSCNVDRNRRNIHTVARGAKRNGTKRNYACTARFSASIGIDRKNVCRF